MKENIAGRVARMNLKPSNALYPVFEAVSNSIDAIDARFHDLGAGRIRIELQREYAQEQLGEVDRVDPIRAIVVTDNGIGFTPENFESFDEADTEYKLSIGGKGVGRFTWLKVFETTRVESVYHGKRRRKRTFTFALPEGIQDHEERAAKAADGGIGTRVVMQAPKDPYYDELRSRAGTIAAALVRHFLSYLITDNPPTIEVIDGDAVIPITASDAIARSRTTFQIKEHEFTIEHVKVTSPEKPQHAAYYCARHRAVKEDRLKHLPDTRLRDGDTTFYYQAYVTSPYLDATANELRTGFDIDDDQSDLDGVSLNTIREQVRAQANTYLGPELQELTSDRDTRVDRVIAQRVPELAYIKEEHAAELQAAIPLGATDATVEETIGAIHLQKQRTSRALLSNFVSDLQSAATIDLATFETRFAERIEQITRPSQANLAGYVLYRRSIIDIYREILKKSGDKYQREAAVHKLLFPMGVDANKAKAVDNNLWLLDERLTFADYIASDKALNQHQVLFDVTSDDEPDIACYFNLGFSEDDPAEGALHTVVIVELKRPGPVPKRPESPWAQVIRYIRKMQEGSWTEDGRRIKAVDSTRFYCYILCDLDNATIEQMMLDHQFSPIFDGEGGYYLYHDKLKAYAELVPFERVLADVERKHRAFFERLGLAK